MHRRGCARSSTITPPKFSLILDRTTSGNSTIHGRTRSPRTSGPRRRRRASKARAGPTSHDGARDAQLRTRTAQQRRVRQSRWDPMRGWTAGHHFSHSAERNCETSRTNISGY
jgi:hypothetical protein